jgi:hypothetical protein
MVRVAGVVADPGDTDNQFPPDALAVKLRLPELAVTSEVAVTLVVDPAFANRSMLLGFAVSVAAFAEAAAAKNRKNAGVGTRTRNIALLASTIILAECDQIQ